MMKEGERAYCVGRRLGTVHDDVPVVDIVVVDEVDLHSRRWIFRHLCQLLYLY